MSNEAHFKSVCSVFHRTCSHHKSLSMRPASTRRRSATRNKQTDSFFESSDPAVIDDLKKRDLDTVLTTPSKIALFFITLLALCLCTLIIRWYSSRFNHSTSPRIHSTSSKDTRESSKWLDLDGHAALPNYYSFDSLSIAFIWGNLCIRPRDMTH